MSRKIFHRTPNLPICRPAELPICRPADLPTCRNYGSAGARPSSETKFFCRSDFSRDGCW
ncbi:MAG: hypothetical protein ACK4I8_03480 [Armatimonadota bacterium]